MERERERETSGGRRDGSRGPALGRRGALALATAVGTGGCLSRVQSLVDRQQRKRVSVTIKTVPADTDERATRIAGVLAENLGKVGIDTRVTPMAREELYRDVLLNGTFDLYVGRHPDGADPDFLRSLLHSRFAPNPGWQNPFGYANLRVDELLDAQRVATGAVRGQRLRALQREVVRTQPFAVVAFPDDVRASDPARVGEWSRDRVHRPVDYLRLATPDDADAAGAVRGTGGRPRSRLKATVTDARATKNLNPLAVEFRNHGTIIGLLYDPLGKWIDGEVVPWLAEEWTWERDEGPAVTVALRSGLTWHDGTPLDADDVAFTYRFLQDTSLGRAKDTVPAPVYRGASSLVESVEVADDRHVRVRFRPCNRRVAARAFAVPVLPEHVWTDRARQATLGGVDTGVRVTEALVWNNPEPVGSGPFRFERSRTNESLRLCRFDDHFLVDEPVDDRLEPFEGGFAFEELEFVVVPSDAAAVSLLVEGGVDLTASTVSADLIPTLFRHDDLALHVGRPTTFYHLGFNVRNGQNANPRFRRAVASLLDKASLVDEVFEGYARPAASPLAQHPSLAPELAWDGEDPELPFPGTDGRLDRSAARDVFREAGYRYSNDGRLLAG